jgi:multicomponent Na+:H+ antiporter subunit F
VSAVVVVCTALLVVAAGLCVWRAIRSHGVVDRAVAIDLLTIVLISGIAVRVALDGDGVMVDVALVLGLLGFLTTATVARYLGRGR